jgi:HrpA-like RNA helicase
MSSVILLLKASNVDDVLGFDYMDPPSRETLLRSLEELYALEAIGDQQQLTPLGRRMAEFPLEPSFSKVLIKSLSAVRSNSILFLYFNE